MFSVRKRKLFLFSALCILLLPAFLSAATTAELKRGLDTVWVLIAAFLVFFMQAGFGMVEAGFIRAKNTVNILTKNFLDFCMASIGFFPVRIRHHVRDRE